MPDKRTVLIIQGTPISPGLAEGIIHVHRNILGPIDAPVDIAQRNVEEEFSRLDVATAKISDDLVTLATRVEKEIDSRLASVFGAHQLIVDDASLRAELRKEILDNLVTASSAVKTVFLRWEKRFLLMESHIARDKGDDIRDVSIRLSNALAGITVHPLDEIPHGSVLATSRLLPSDTVFLAGRSTSAVLLEYGSIGSHAALFAREMGLPCISGLSNILTTVPNGALALVDADTGTITIRPQEKQKLIFRRKVDDKEHAQHLARQHARVAGGRPRPDGQERPRGQGRSAAGSGGSGLPRPTVARSRRVAGDGATRRATMGSPRLCVPKRLPYQTVATRRRSEALGGRSRTRRAVRRFPRHTHVRTRHVGSDLRALLDH